MCEILICVKNRPQTGNSVFDSKQPKQGDVVSVMPDGWAWGRCELGQNPDANDPNGNYNFIRIVKLPNVTVNQASAMLAPEADVDPMNPSPYLQYRAFFLDKSKIPAGVLNNYWNDDTRAQSTFTLQYTAAQLNTIKSKRTPVPF